MATSRTTLFLASAAMALLASGAVFAAAVPAEIGPPANVVPAEQLSPLSQRMQDVQDILGRLTGQVEELGHQIDQMSQTMDRMQKQLDLQASQLPPPGAG